MNIGIIGAGTIVPYFLQGVSSVDGITVMAIAGQESDLEVMNNLKKEHGITHVFTDYHHMLESDIDTVYVAVPNHLHYQFAKVALKMHKNVLLEKPFASTYEQAKELVDLAKEQEVILFEAISNQYLPNYIKTKELLSQLGDIKIVQLNYSQYSRRYDLFKEGQILPVFDPKKSGGALMDINVYNIHFVVGLFGRPNKISYIANIERGIDTSGILTLEYSSFQCVAIGAKDCQSPVSVNIQGDKGYIHSDSPANGYDKFTLGTNLGEKTSFELNEKSNHLCYEIVRFRDLVHHHNTKEASILNELSLEVVRILDEARKQVGIEI
ncbi:Gfo/Idh/MocA family protein [Anaeromicropila herbilytica]|uniref:NAD(P)-dependent oxidoreductase n=1 Tax=Anaeromicropila herbilytica TaxID=2785025 RepID=A0A7R7EL10_9FIRM|nr:Gfo/Idh/MocA family oxidoreductase [Anaeromicropila herbilytica]BCN30836.1 NAD(P)-dependent oxidoreductase [Anaeromicropila herbilytica]